MLSFKQKVDWGSHEFPFELSLANPFLAHYEQIWLNDCPNEFLRVCIIKDKLTTCFSYFNFLTTLKNLMNI